MRNARPTAKPPSVQWIANRRCKTLRAAHSASTTPISQQGDATLPVMLSILFAGPMLFIGAMDLLFSTYFLKFSTDSLLIAPGIMGGIFTASRLWDAISDPIAGYLSDATRSRFGRRRLWLLASAVPLWLSFFATFSPPNFPTQSLVSWVACSVLLFYTATTAFRVPHYSFGAELTENVAYHERSALFSWRSMLEYGGNLLGVGMMFLVMRQEAFGPAAVRRVAAPVSFGMGAIAAAAIIALVSLVDEPHAEMLETRPHYEPLRVAQRVMSSPLARRMTLLWALADGSRAMFASTAPYAIQYALGLPASLVPPIVLAFVVSAMASVPAWLARSRDHGKVTTWQLAIACNAGSYLLFLPVLHPATWSLSLTVRIGFAATAATTAGACTGATSALANSLQSDVIDADAAECGESAHGAYFAWWNFVSKSAGGAVSMLVGVSLQLAGFVPNVEQTPLARQIIASLFIFVPLIGLSCAASLFDGFELNERMSLEVRQTLARRWANERRQLHLSSSTQLQVVEREPMVSHLPASTGSTKISDDAPALL